MKTHLNELFQRGGYDRDDAAYLLGVLGQIEAHDEARTCFEEAMHEYEKSGPCDYARVLTLADDAARHIGVHEYTTELLLYMCLSKTLLSRYHGRKIDEEIYWNSMLDLRYKLEECKAVKGVRGSFVASWFEGFFNMTRVALGRLQFEIVTFDHDYEKDGKKLTPDSKVINVHIPRTGTPLAPDVVEDAYRQAAEYFADDCNGDIVFVCYSWLLYPENETILGENSNIVKFMKRYDIARWGVDKNKSDLWRLFDTTESNPDRLPADTSARRAYIRHIRAGGRLGWGYGVLFY